MIAPLSDDEIETSCVCPCPSCESPTYTMCVDRQGDPREPHAARRRKAESIAHDIATLGYLPEHGP